MAEGVQPAASSRPDSLTGKLAGPSVCGACPPHVATDSASAPPSWGCGLDRQ